MSLGSSGADRVFREAKNPRGKIPFLTLEKLISYYTYQD